MVDYIEREEVKKEIIEWASLLTNPKFLDRDATLDIIDLITPADIIDGSELLKALDEQGRYIKKE
jgi:hypothetical protein